MRISLNLPYAFTDGARTVIIHSQEHARRLGHSHRGGEHYLLALAAADLPVAAVLREHGVTPGRVEEEIVRLEGLGPAAALFAGLDTVTLAAGVDLSAVRDRVEASFGPDALARAGQATQKKPRRPSGLNPKNPRPMRTGPVGRWRIRRQARHAVPLPPVPPAPPGIYQAPDPRPAEGHPADPRRLVRRAPERRRSDDPPRRHPCPRRAPRARLHRHDHRAGAAHPVRPRHVSARAAHRDPRTRLAARLTPR